MTREPPPTNCDIVVVGGGIVGLAVAREIALRRPAAKVAVLEKEPELAAHQTGHSSGVVHAGIYYAPGSLKARLCTEGSRELYDYCEQHQIAHARTGKVIVATSAAELPGLDELERRGRANGVLGLKRLDAAALHKIEPHARGIEALHSPHTGIADFKAVAEQLARDVKEAGGSVTTACEVLGLEEAHQARRIRTRHARGATTAKQAIVCAGLWADRLATSQGAPADPRIVPFRGAYLRLDPRMRHLV